MNAVLNERMLLCTQIDRTQHGYRLTVQVPDMTTGSIREYEYEYATLAAVHMQLWRIQSIWLDAEHIALTDSLESC